MSHYKHLTIREREMILIKRIEGTSIRGISVELKRSSSTISRELKRNHSEHQQYSPRASDKKLS